MPAVSVRPVVLLAVALCAAAPAFAQDPEVVPEDPLPPPPAQLPLAPVGPVATAPDARDLLKECGEESFTDCFRLWRPPPPPEPEPPSPPAATAGIPPGAPREPAVGSAASTPGPPPPGPTAEDQATYDALVRAVREAGLENRILLPPPPLGTDASPSATPLQKAPKSP